MSASSKRLMLAVRALVSVSAALNFDFFVFHLSGTANPAADALSRLQIDAFRKILPTADCSPTPASESAILSLL